MTDPAESVSTKRSTKHDFWTEHYESKSTNVTDTSPTLMPVKYTTGSMITHPESSTLQTTYLDHMDGKTSINSISSNLSISGYVQNETVENAQEQTSTVQSLTQTSKVVTTSSSITLSSDESTKTMDIHIQSSTLEQKNTFPHDVFVFFS
ncbi:hypothetical protein RF11_08211 [Thelohanellus kitauei]|uniref:Uncharacterized protein n=1 Tax=Thelohanellus kitauei TaxID=669202 RepID=A0A0C2NBV5_THEKT|nr:hypothetical protein RF11_08211 [Thelohanellus kitauei]